MKIGKHVVKRLGLVCLLILISFPVYAETSGADTSEGSKKDIRYVRDFIVITLRAGMGDEYKVIGNLKTDTRLEVLQDEGEFLRVKTGDGEEGWVRSRYIAEDVPKPFIIEGLRNENNSLKTNVASLKTKIAELSEQKSMEIEQRDGNTRQLQRQLKNSEKEIAALEKEKARAEIKYDKLLKSSSNVASLLKELEDIKKKNSKLNQEMGELRNTNRLLESDKEELIRLRLIKWFLSGGGVLFVGFLLGWMFRRKDYY